MIHNCLLSQPTQWISRDFPSTVVYDCHIIAYEQQGTRSILNDDLEMTMLRDHHPK